MKTFMHALETEQREWPLWLLMGASGRIGRMLMRHWTGAPPVGLHIVPQHRGPGPGLVWGPLDGPDPLIELARSRGGIAGLIVLSGVTPAPGADLAGNGALILASVTAAQTAGIGRLLVASSSAVYGGGMGLPLGEDDLTLPVNDYGRAKLVAEAICDQARQTGLAVTALRIGNVAGADALLVNASRALYAEGEANALRIDRFADGCGPLRSYIGPATLAAVLETLMRHSDPLPDCLNIAAPAPVSMESLATAAGAPWQFVPAPPTSFQQITLNCGRLTALHAFPADASDPAAMVAEWQRLKDPA